MAIAYAIIPMTPFSPLLRPSPSAVAVPVMPRLTRKMSRGTEMAVLRAARFDAGAAIAPARVEVDAMATAPASPFRVNARGFWSLTGSMMRNMMLIRMVAISIWVMLKRALPQKTASGVAKRRQKSAVPCSSS